MTPEARNRSVRCLLSFVFVAGLVVTASSAASAEDAVPTRATHWLSLINETHTVPTGLTVVILPPAYVSSSAMVSDPSWLTGMEPVADHPGVRAAVEATSYWQWAIAEFHDRWPHLQGLTFTVKVLGLDATAQDLNEADIVVTTAMAGDPVPGVFHLGVGMPSDAAWWLGLEDDGMSKCTVWNTGLGSGRGDDQVVRLRNLIIHEFGHCLAVGHTGTSLGLEHTSRAYGVFDQHPTDVMSTVVGSHRQCISNLNVQSLAEGYDFLRTGSGWTRHDGETFMLKSDYQERCLPESMYRF